MDTRDPERVVEYIAINLRRLRLAGGLTQATLAHRAQLDLTYVQRLERGRQNPTIRTLARVASAVGVDAMELLRPSTEPLVRPGAGRPLKRVQPQTELADGTPVVPLTASAHTAVFMATQGLANPTGPNTGDLLGVASESGDAEPTDRKGPARIASARATKRPT